MSDLMINADRLLDLAGAVCNRSASEKDFVELDSILRADQVSCGRYLDYCQIHGALRLQMRACRAAQKVCQQISINSKLVLQDPSEFDVATAETLPAISIGFLPTAIRGTIGFFSQELPFSLLIAAVLTGLGLWFASMIYVSSPDKIAKNSLLPTKTSFDPTLKVVGKITGMVDCKWADPNSEAINGANVLLGRKYALASGLVEITYDTGAKVVLQGPVTYEVESTNGGFLSVGKLTGMVENEAAKGFSVRTPTTVVIDLGTEFSVDVQPDRSTVVHVIRGVVNTVRDDRTGGVPVCERLMAGEAIRFSSRLTDPPQRISGRTSHVILPPDLRAAVQQVNKARASRMLLKPTGLVASAYHRIWNVGGKLVADNDRHLAFRMATDGVFGRGEKNQSPRSSFDTFKGPENSGQTNQKSSATSSSLSTIHYPLSTSFVGLLYNRPMRFDRIKVFLGRQMGDGGNWASMPRVFILKKPVDTDLVAPESNPENWRELCLDQLFCGASFDVKYDANPGAVLECLLTGFSEEQRTGYGWALGGAPGDGPAGYVSVTELRGYGMELQNMETTKGDSEVK